MTPAIFGIFAFSFPFHPFVAVIQFKDYFRGNFPPFKQALLLHLGGVGYEKHIDRFAFFFNPLKAAAA